MDIRFYHTGYRTHPQWMGGRGGGQLAPILDDLVDHGPRVVDVLGDPEPDLVPELLQIALERVAHVRFILKGQDCQGHDSSSCG